jgi:hypothetical protein
VTFPARVLNAALAKSETVTAAKLAERADALIAATRP